MDNEFNFKRSWQKYGLKAKKFIMTYINNGLDAKAAAIEAGFHGRLLREPNRLLRKYNKCISYLLKKNDIIRKFSQARIRNGTIYEII